MLKITSQSQSILLGVGENGEFPDVHQELGSFTSVWFSDSTLRDSALIIVGDPAWKKTCDYEEVKTQFASIRPNRIP